MLLLIQIVFPLVLLAALSVRTRGRVTKALQAGAVFVYLLAVHLAGLWLDLPLWTPWLLWALYAGGLLAGRRPKEAGSRAAWPGWFAPAPFDADPLPIRIGGRYLLRGDRL